LPSANTTISFALNTSPAGSVRDEDHRFSSSRSCDVNSITLATLCYRLTKVLRDAPAEFAACPEGDAQNAGKVLTHIGDLMDWALSMVNGQMRWQDSTPLSWPDEIARVYRAMEALDARLTESGAGWRRKSGCFRDRLRMHSRTAANWR
jgi:hypothetical protein